MRTFEVLVVVLLVLIAAELALIVIQMPTDVARAQMGRPRQDPVPVVIVDAPSAAPSTWGLAPSLTHKVRVTGGGRLIVCTWPNC